jgi:hypothetical protein
MNTTAIEDFHISNFEEKLRIFKAGRVAFPELKDEIGISLLKLPGFLQVTLTVDQFPQASLPNWHTQSIEIADRLGIRKPFITTTGIPFLTHYRERIYRIIVLSDDPSAQARLRLYSRLFSPRTEEVTLELEFLAPFTFKSPRITVDNVVSNLMAVGLVPYPRWFDEPYEDVMNYLDQTCPPLD